MPQSWLQAWGVPAADPQTAPCPLQHMTVVCLLAAFLILNIHELIQASLSISYNEPETLQGLDVSL